MLNILVDGISLKLNEVFGDSYKIYTDDIKQGLKEPCFFINLLNSISKIGVFQRYIKDYYFVIQYLPILEYEKNSEINSIAERLCECLEYIKLRNKYLIRGKDISYEVVDGVLNFNVKYSLHAIKQEEIDKMDKMLTKIDIGR